MRAYVSPEFVFDREPTRRDAIARIGERALIAMRALFELDNKTRPIELQRVFESDASLREYGSVFTERWRAVLGDRLKDGVHLRTLHLPYRIDTTLREDDTVPYPPEVESRCETVMDVTVTQPGGHATYLRMESRTTRLKEGAVYRSGHRPAPFFAIVSPLHADGSVDNDGRSTYTYAEAAELHEVMVRVMQELDAASAVPGALEIIDL